MPPRKRPSRARVRVPAPEPVSAPSARPVARLTRATTTVPDGTDLLVSRRPADHWRGRLQCLWRLRGTCEVCHKPRFVLSSLIGDAAVCDLAQEVQFLRESGACTCTYAELEPDHAPD